MDLSVIRAKLNKRNTRHYNSPDQFVADVYLMFHNCAKFNYVSKKLTSCIRVFNVQIVSQLQLILVEIISIIIISHYFTSTDLSVIAPSLSDHSLTLRWPKQAAALRRSSPPSWKKFSQTEFSPQLRRTLTAMSTTRPTGPPRVVSPGRRGGSSATGRGRGDTLSSRGEITSNQRCKECNHGHKYAEFVCNYTVFIFPL